MTNLEEFWAYNNDLTRTIPEQLGSLTHLTVLALDENKLSGYIPTELEQLVSLAQLNLSGQRSGKRIQGPLLSFSSNPNLIGVSIGCNNLKGPIPPDFLRDVDHNMDIKIDLSFTC